MATFLQRLRPHSLHEPRAEGAYRTRAQQLVGRVRAIFDDWIAVREVEPDNNRLANAAAVNRWELMRLVQEAEALEPPRALAALHRDVLNAVSGAARACQLLASGYRSHKSIVVCDGQALLLDTVNEIDDLVGRLQMRF
jgi:hypothetical protein